MGHCFAVALQRNAFAMPQPTLVLKAVKRRWINHPNPCLFGSVPKVVRLRTHSKQHGIWNAMMSVQKLVRPEVIKQRLTGFNRISGWKNDAASIKNFDCPVQVPGTVVEGIQNQVLGIFNHWLENIIQNPKETKTSFYKLGITTIVS